LSRVIDALVANAEAKKKGRKLQHVPVRDSLLTQLLSASLMGNSKTFLIAAISPTDYNYE